MIPEGIAESFVEFQWYNRLREVREVSSKDIGCIVDSITRPVKTFAIAIWRVKYVLKFFDTFSRAAQTENALDVRGYIQGEFEFGFNKWIASCLFPSGIPHIWQ